ncbi:MAG: hypothetical protein IT330_08105 [Anaerolineae bacterium]|nr:hypothetical protein [Anaerolineae bacterium]
MNRFIAAAQIASLNQAGQEAEEEAILFVAGEWRRALKAQFLRLDTAILL